VQGAKVSSKRVNLENDRARRRRIASKISGDKSEEVILLMNSPTVSMATAAGRAVEAFEGAELPEDVD